MNIGITGWHGFIGSYLKEKIGNPILFQGDLRNLEEVKSFTKGCDRIYHLAGLNRENEGNILANNILSTGNLILSLKLQELNPEIIFLSSRQVEWNPCSEYGLTKLIEESIVKTAENKCIFRAPNVYGVGGKPFYNSVVATFAYQVAHGQEVTINDPLATREFVFVEDLVDSLVRYKFYKHRRRYICVRGEIMTIGEVYEYLTSRLGEHENLKKSLDYWENYG